MSKNIFSPLLIFTKLIFYIGGDSYIAADFFSLYDKDLCKKISVV